MPKDLPVNPICHHSRRKFKFQKEPTTLQMQSQTWTFLLLMVPEPVQTPQRTLRTLYSISITIRNLNYVRVSHSIFFWNIRF